MAGATNRAAQNRSDLCRFRGGHRAAAAALCKVFDEQALPWDVRMVCIQDLLAPIDIIRKATGTPSQEIYNILLRHGWTAGSDHMIRAMHLLIRAFHSRQVRVLAEYWSARMPDLVVSLIPHFNRAIKDSLDRVDGRIPLITILTDIADFPPHFWIEPQDQFVICGVGPRGPAGLSDRRPIAQGAARFRNDSPSPFL